MKFLRFLISLLLDQFGWTTEMDITGVTEIDEAIPEFWAAGIIKDGDRESFWGGLTGKEGSRMPIIMKTGPLKAKGDQVTFNTIEALMQAKRSGENVLKGYEGVLGIGSFTVTVDVVRFAVAVTRKSTKQANFEEVKMAGELLKDRMTREFDNDIFNEIISSSNVTTLYAGTGNTEVGDLNSTDADIFAINEIEKIRMALIRQGAPPLKMLQENGRAVPVYGMCYGEIEEYRLNQNTVFTQAIREGWERFKKGGQHPLFQGAIGIYRNMLFYPYYSILPIPQGTPLRPETVLSGSLSTTATTISVGGPAVTGPGSEDNTPDYTAFFASSGSLQIEDEIISYTDKGKNYFSCVAGRGASSTTAALHADESLVTERNIATVIGFGAEAVFKALPEDAEPIGQKDDYQEQIGLGIRAYYGQKVRIDKRRGKCPSIVLMKVYSENPGIV